MASSDHDYNNYRIPIPEEFQEVYSHFYFAENDTNQQINKTIVPTYRPMMIFNLGNPASITSAKNIVFELKGKCLILGPVKHSFGYSLPVGAEILVVSFKGDGLYRFLGNAPLREKPPINSNGVLQKICFMDLWNALRKMNSVPDRINRILEFSRPYIKHRKPGSAVIANGNEKKSMLNPIKVIAEGINQTERNIQIKHKKYLGFSAKEINRYNRFLQAVELIQSIIANSGKIDWLEIVNQCNYYDQSQLIRDFNHYMKISPKIFLKFQKDICRKAPE